jgi:hypothetical protein
MSAFLITKKSSNDWDLPIFEAGEAEAIAVFTTAVRASQYLRENRLDQDHEVSEATAIELIEVMLAAQESGVVYMAINPDELRQRASTSWGPLTIDATLSRFAADFAQAALRKNTVTSLNWEIL